MSGEDMFPQPLLLMHYSCNTQCDALLPSSAGPGARHLQAGESLQGPPTGPASTDLGLLLGDLNQLRGWEPGVHLQPHACPFPLYPVCPSMSPTSFSPWPLPPLRQASILSPTR